VMAAFYNLSFWLMGAMLILPGLWLISKKNSKA